MNHKEMELDYAFGDHYYVDKWEGFTPAKHCITLCGHIHTIINDRDAHCVFLPRYNFSVQVCCSCFTKSHIYAVGSDPQWEETITKRYNHFKMDEHTYVWFGTLEQFQIHLSSILNLSNETPQEVFKEKLNSIIYKQNNNRE